MSGYHRTTYRIGPPGPATGGLCIRTAVDVEYGPQQFEQFNRTPRPVTVEMEAGLRRLGWEDFDRISRRGELRRDALERKVADGEVPAEDAERLTREDDLSWYINELTTDLQMAEHEGLRRTWDSLGHAEKRKAIRDLTPPWELKRRTYESLRERGKVS